MINFRTVDCIVTDIATNITCTVFKARHYRQNHLIILKFSLGYIKKIIFFFKNGERLLVKIQMSLFIKICASI